MINKTKNNVKSFKDFDKNHVEKFFEYYLEYIYFEELTANL